MKNPIRTIRRALQVAFLLLFIGLLWEARWHATGSAPPAQWFLRMDPLSGLVTALAPTHTWLALFWPALVLLALTAIFGRFFCGWICPLGTCIDGFDHIFLRRRKQRHPWLNRPSWKYYILGVVLVAALFGTQLGWILDPIPLATRTFAVVAYPIVIGAYNLGVVKGWPILDRLGLDWYPTDVNPGFSLNLAVLLVFATVLGLSVISRRYWCRTLCPLGALLAFAGRFGLWNRRVEGCANCRVCEADCKMGAIPEPEEGGDYSRTLQAECIQCYDCTTCPREGTHIGLHMKPKGLDSATGAGRRQFLAALGIGALYGITASAGGGRRATHDRLIRPPGAIMREPGGGIRNMSESEFRDLCLRCGACMKACVTGGIQPAVVEAGFDGLFTPILVPKIGHCEQSCTACGDVCPSGALGKFTVEEKTHIHIGLATVDQNKCLSWRRGKQYRLCLVCDEHCPYDAISIIKNHDGLRAPFVNADKCVGCGQCEHVCPEKPEAAIVVHRSDAGI